jgi:hypothetical protein
MQADGAHIRVLNGSSANNLDIRTANYLSQFGALVTETGNTKATSRTMIILYSPKLYTLRYLVDVFGVTSNTQILIKNDPTQTVDVEVRLGKDWITKLPPDVPTATASPME